MQLKLPNYYSSSHCCISSTTKENHDYKVHMQGGVEARSVATPDWPWTPPWTCVGSCLPAITCMGPPPCPISEQCSTVLWIPRLPKLCLLSSAQTHCPRILHFRSPHCEYKPEVPLPHAIPSPSTEPQPGTLSTPSPDRDIVQCMFYHWPRTDLLVQTSSPSHRS